MPPFPLPTLTGAMAEDDDKPVEQPVATCRIAQGTLVWLAGSSEQEEQGYLVGHAACPGRSFPDILGALAKRPGCGTWREDMQVRRLGKGCFSMGRMSMRSVLGVFFDGPLLAAYPRTDPLTSSLSHIQELENHLSAGLEIVGAYGDSFVQTAAACKELGLSMPSVLAECALGAVSIQDTEVHTPEGLC